MFNVFGVGKVFELGVVVVVPAASNKPGLVSDIMSWQQRKPAAGFCAAPFLWPPSERKDRLTSPSDESRTRTHHRHGGPARCPYPEASSSRAR